MRRFRFSLQPVRLLREQREQTARQRYADALRACEEAALQLQSANEELARGWAAACDDLAAGVAASRLLRTRAWCGVLEFRQKERVAAFEKTRQAVDTALREVMIATREREALDHYHDKRRRAYDRDAQREEQKELDEIGIRRAGAPGALASPAHFEN